MPARAQAVAVADFRENALREFLLIVVIVAVVAVLWHSGPVQKRIGQRRRSGQVDQLQRRYLSMLPMGPAAARAHLDRVLADMRREHPGRSTAWLLRKMIHELKRDRA